MATPPRSEGVNEEMRKADEYLRKNSVMEMYNDLCAGLAFHKPHDVRDFLIQDLQRREHEGAEAGFFEDTEIVAVFNLMDLMQTGIISDKQAREALRSLTNPQKQKEAVEVLELAEEIDSKMFQDKARETLRYE
mmetsp:Transcript_47918/g.95324  ORF Transcript_47918/g.95324 Transcript_47918/m.95324 type:complete len:134 (+) Transcript_47918:67-468(+)|eukprot:CAMPEP_0172706524 /NCGR_PEP_ID=MMETSP1074-20121228/46092_1 /TAXON_ID=2916 /ORGANISM="Ceratium fusus, Strain PA161109" /LENGTH=133 /DNA_ID=CAMNT_0013529123 /DNA_START=54 /DNA_END=455 /DNA_ORIENTATION=+